MIAFELVYKRILFHRTRLDNRLAKTGMPTLTDVPTLPQTGSLPSDPTKVPTNTNPYLVEIVGKSIPPNGKQFQTTSALKIEVHLVNANSFSNK